MIKVTIVGPDALYPAKERVKKGDKVILKKEHFSKYPHTISCSLGDGSVIGNVAKSYHTVKKGCKSASDIFDTVGEEFEGVVTDIVTVVFSNGRESTGLIVSINTEKKEKEAKEEKGGKTTMNAKTLLALVEGSKKFHPYKYTVAPLLKEGKEVPVTLEVGDNQIRVLYEHEGKIDSCGEIQQEGDGHFVGLQEILGAFERYKVDGKIEYMAKLTGIEKTVRYVLQIDFKGETAFETMLNRIKTEGILTEQEIQERLDWLDKLSLNEKNKMEVFRNMRIPKDKSRIPQGPFKFINSNMIAELAITSYNARLNILLEGPKGSGKNTLIEDLGKLYYVPVYESQINSQTDNETLLGSRTIKAKETYGQVDKFNNCMAAILAAMSGNDKMLAPIAKTLMNTLIHGEDEEKIKQLNMAEFLMSMDFSPIIDAIKSNQTEVVFQPSVLIKAMEEGGIIVFDEINTGHPSVLALLNSILDNRRRIQVPGYGLVKAHPNFRVFATMNKDYQGTFELNEATASRFSPIVFEEPASIREIIKKNVPNVDKETLNVCDNLYESIRKNTREGRMQSQAINVRAFIHSCMQVEWGIPLKVALINNVANSCPDLDDRAAIKALIDLLF